MAARWGIIRGMRPAILLLVVLSGLAAQSDSAILDSLKGKALLALRGPEQRVGYANIEKLAPVNTIRRGERVYPLRNAPRDFSIFAYDHKGTRQSVDDFMRQMNAVGVLVITDGR